MWGGGVRKLGDERSIRAEERDSQVDPAGESAPETADWLVEKPLQKLIEKIMTNKRASANEKTQAPAEKIAKNMVGNAGGGEAVIHGRDGKVRDKDTVSPGRDLNPPKGTKH